MSCHLSYGIFLLRVNIFLMHPRLLTTLIPIDPVIQQASIPPLNPSGSTYTRSSTFRRDPWPSRFETVIAFSQKPTSIFLGLSRPGKVASVRPGQASNNAVSSFGRAIKYRRQASDSRNTQTPRSFYFLASELQSA